MSDTPRAALHQARTGITDVLEGYETLADRAEPQIRPVIDDLRTLHQRHATDLDRRLSGLGEATDAHASIQGTVNKVVVTLRDWVSTLDDDVLAFIRDGEERLADIYRDALTGWSAGDDTETARLLEDQRREIEEKARQLPAE